MDCCSSINIKVFCAHNYFRSVLLHLFCHVLLWTWILLWNWHRSKALSRLFVSLWNQILHLRLHHTQSSLYSSFECLTAVLVLVSILTSRWKLHIPIELCVLLRIFLKFISINCAVTVHFYFTGSGTVCSGWFYGCDTDKQMWIKHSILGISDPHKELYYLWLLV